MVFSSVSFLFLFLPLVLIINKILPFKYKNLFLLFSSLFFYFWGEGGLVLIMLFSITLNYATGLFLSNSYVKKSIVLSIGIILNIGLIGYYKYANFICENLSIKLASVSLPIGISFFTFQGISYLLDVYRDEKMIQRNWFQMGLYISLFPQLIAGPIVRYHDVADQIVNRKESSQLFYSGLLRFITGLFKKMMFANTAALIADDIFSYTSYANIPTMVAWLGVCCYSLQIYFDFSGYSDMAIGLGRMFGFKFLENFNYPYISTSIQEFWRRWHISLGSWFRDYLYIPLGGNRLSNYRTYFNLLIVFFATGLWHGASWNFVLWGLWHGLFIILERLFIGSYLKKLRISSWFYTIFVVMIGWVLFRVDTFYNFLEYMRSLVGYNNGQDYLGIRFLNPKNGFLLLLSLFCAAPLKRYLCQLQFIKSNLMFIQAVLLVFGFILSVTAIVNSSYNPFIYFRF